MANLTGVKGPHQKPFRDALRLAIAEAEDNPRRLRKIAEALYDKAADGDVAAIKEIGDRLDGKVPQGIIGGDDDDPAVKVEHIQRTIVDPKNAGNPDRKGSAPTT